MKSSKFLLILLFFIISLVFISCNYAQAMFDDGLYEKAIIELDSKKYLNKQDHLLKIKSYVNLGNMEGARESTLLYLLMADSEDERSMPVQVFMELGYSDPLNVLILKTSDGLKAQSILFKSYYNLGQYDIASDILNNYLASELSLVQYIQILIDYPFDNVYTMDVFNSWYEMIGSEEVSDYLSLFTKFSDINLSDSEAVNALNHASELENNPIFSSDSMNLSKIYLIKSRLCYKLHDSYNGELYYQNSIKLNPGR